ncbi:UDP-N-acetylmuramoyl-L-alanyl-D-glutamate--2,6-diaminopimelate ligase [Bacillus horti]|uniref:UDP-N-acetylmuramoyl-L-alanyl-D-glutamate--2,6-diaminopimelate ligase n=2 Tax=Caldalkalibacillus horti TaxID=77523 RepID=A0ABT9VUD9_9BACI|nr:UDP-N-acetylmuramoyl-L-alanyl-D-glutamate--2,6-diaminopimelate ligase [Bacillus horti]
MIKIKKDDVQRNEWWRNRMKIRELLHTLTPYYFFNEKWDDITISSIEMDSRLVTSGTLFVCIEGAQTDGHLYVDQAVELGAVAIVAQKKIEATVPVIIVPDTRRSLAFLAAEFFRNPTKELGLIGVTGTNGKTTVTHLLEAIFEGVGNRTGRIGTIGTKIGDTLREGKNTTPESLELQRSFREMVDAGCKYAFMEVSSHAIQMGRIRGCQFKTAIFTNLTQDHLDYHGTMEEYKRAKGLLFAQLGSSYDSDKLKYAIINGDDPVSQYYMDITPAQVITYGIDSQDVDVRATNIKISSEGMQFTVESFMGTEDFRVQLLGKFNVYNLLSTIAAGLVEGISLSQIKQSLEQVKGVRGRLESVSAGQGFSVVVDYAHTPDSLENVLLTAKEFAENRVLCVIGCGGDRDRTKRPIMAQIAARHADYSVLTSDNPRTEEPAQILEDMIQGLTQEKVSKELYTSLVDRREAIYTAIEMARPGDVVIIAGKGHETYQDINNQKLHFDDREVVLEALGQRKNEE